MKKFWIALAVLAVVGTMAARAILVTPCTEQEKADTGANWAVEFTDDDLTGTTTNTAQTFTNCFAVPAKWGVDVKAAKLIKAFDDGEMNRTCGLTLKVGNVTLSDLFLKSMELAADGTEVFIKYGASGYAPVFTMMPATNVTGLGAGCTQVCTFVSSAYGLEGPVVYTTAGWLNFTFTPSEATPADFVDGKVKVYIKIWDAR